MPAHLPGPPCRRSAVRLVALLATAAVCAGFPAGSATAATGTVPAVPATLFGQSVQLQPGETYPAALARLESTYRAPLGVVRMFQSTPDARVFGVLGGRSGIISFRPAPADVLDGAYDDQLRAFFAAAPTDRPTWWSYFHEADVAWSQGNLPDLVQFRAAWTHIAQLARAAGNPQLRATAILVGWTASPYSRRDVRWFLPDDTSLVDVLAFDNYNSAATDAGSYGDAAATIATDKAAADSIGVRFGVAEYASVIAGSDYVGRADYLRQFAQAAGSSGAAFVSYWNSNGYGTSPEYRLLDPAGQLAEHDVLAGTPITAPDAPAAVTVLPGAGALAVSWLRGDDHGDPRLAFTVSAVDAVSGAPVGTVTATGPLSAAVRGLVNGRTYRVTVTAANSAGTGPTSTPSAGTAGGLLTVPGAPLVPLVTEDDGALDVAWTPPATDGGSPVLGYTVTATDTATGTPTATTVPATTSAATLSGLTNGRSYRVTVAATNAFGTGSPAAGPLATPFTEPGRPGQPTVTSGNAQLGVRWTAPDSTGGHPVSSYELRAYGPGGALLATTTVPGTSTTGTIGGLTNGKAYTVAVLASNGLVGDPSDRSVPVAPLTVPAAPTINGYGGSWSDALASINVWWTASPASGGTPVTGYRVSTYAVGSTTPVQVSPLLPASDPRNLTVNGLVTGGQYRVSVVAYNAVGASAPSPLSAPVTAH